MSPLLAVAAAMQESGLTPAAVGDRGCSKGIYQVNECVHGKAPADTIQPWIDSVARNSKRKGWDELRAAVRWNWPVAAEQGFWKEAKYYWNLRANMKKLQA